MVEQYKMAEQAEVLPKNKARVVRKQQKKCSRLLNVPGALKVFQANKKKKGNKNKIKGKQQKLGQKEWK